jgi:nicotinate-nucleotide adenylyltransferase
VAAPHDALTSEDAAPAGGLGVLGGSFNPPHRGHIELARHARPELALDRVLLAPARISPGKPVEDDPGPGHRLEMCRLAAADVEGVEVCALEIEREGPSYTVDTLRTLHAAHPHTELTFILGADVAATLPAWHEAAELPALARFAVALRPDVEHRPDPAGFSSASHSDPAGFPIVHLHMPMIDASSSLVRERVRRGLPVEELVGPAVATYIAEHRLYKTPIAAPSA